MGHDEMDFDEFFRASWDPCLRAVAASIGNVELAEDQVAEAFTRAFASWQKVSCHPAPKAWVVRTALNAAAPPGQGTGLDAAVVTALRRLPARQREVIVLRVFLDLDIETTARQLRIAPGTVRAHLSRGVAALRNELTPAQTTEVDSCTTTIS